MIRVYCVGIHYRHHIDFVPDLTSGANKYMSGLAVLAASAKKWGLRYKLSTSPPSAVLGHIDYVAYTPNAAQDNDAVDPGSSPRVTFAIFGDKVFPFFGQPLSLTEILSPIGQSSQVLQYTVQSIDGATTPELLIPSAPPAPAQPGFINPANDGRSSFGTIGIPDNSEIRIRSLNIYCTY
jgi:hypothetical protein